MGTKLSITCDQIVKKVEAGVSDRNSYEFSEWLKKWSSYNQRIVIIYRPPYSDNHRVLFSVFLCEFPKYLETLLLCKEQLIITDDFNIHVDDIQNSDSRQLCNL